MTHQEMLDYPTFFGDCGATTLREYFHELLHSLWIEGEDLSGKRPFGNGGWEGVIWYTRLNCWRVVLSKNGKQHSFGYTKDFFEACCRRKSAENLYYGE